MPKPERVPDQLPDPIRPDVRGLPYLVITDLLARAKVSRGVGEQRAPFKSQPDRILPGEDPAEVADLGVTVADAVPALVSHLGGLWHRTADDLAEPAGQRPDPRRMLGEQFFRSHRTA